MIIHATVTVRECNKVMNGVGHRQRRFVLLEYSVPFADSFLFLAEHATKHVLSFSFSFVVQGFNWGPSFSFF